MNIKLIAIAALVAISAPAFADTAEDTDRVNAIVTNEVLDQTRNVTEIMNNEMVQSAIDSSMNNIIEDMVDDSSPK